jgi:hypothetical protein
MRYCTEGDTGTSSKRCISEADTDTAVREAGVKETQFLQ